MGLGAERVVERWRTPARGGRLSARPRPAFCRREHFPLGRAPLGPRRRRRRRSRGARGGRRGRRQLTPPAAPPCHPRPPSAEPAALGPLLEGLDSPTPRRCTLATQATQQKGSPLKGRARKGAGEVVILKGGRACFHSVATRRGPRAARGGSSGAARGVLGEPPRRTDAGTGRRGGRGHLGRLAVGRRHVAVGGE